MSVLKSLLALATSLVLAISVADHADAASSKRKRAKGGQLGKPHVAVVPGRRSEKANDQYEYYENVLERVPFGSKRWWEVYGRQHGTPDG
jgi:hypothetical protein